MAKPIDLERTPFEVIDRRVTATNAALEEASRSMTETRAEVVTRCDIENGLIEVFGLDEIFDLLERDIDSAEIVSLLAGCDFTRLRPISLCEFVLEESIVPVGVPMSLTEAEAKLDGEKWTVHKYDADPFPSNPHAHCYAQALKLHLGDGSLYQRKSKVSCGNIGKKKLLKLRDLIMHKNEAIAPPELAV